MNQIHIGYIGRRQARYRWEGDPREVTLEISVDAANRLLDACNSHPDNVDEKSVIAQIERGLVGVLREEEGMKSSIPTYEEVIELAECPRCGAKAGEKCDRSDIKDKKRTNEVPNHKERLSAARLKRIGR